MIILEVDSRFTAVCCGAAAVGVAVVVAGLENEREALDVACTLPMPAAEATGATSAEAMANAPAVCDAPCSGAFVLMEDVLDCDTSGGSTDTTAGLLLLPAEKGADAEAEAAVGEPAALAAAALSADLNAGSSSATDALGATGACSAR